MSTISSSVVRDSHDTDYSPLPSVEYSASEIAEFESPRTLQRINNDIAVVARDFLHHIPQYNNTLPKIASVSERSMIASVSERPLDYPPFTDIKFKYRNVTNSDAAVAAKVERAAQTRLVESAIDCIRPFHISSSSAKPTELAFDAGARLGFVVDQMNEL